MDNKAYLHFYIYYMKIYHLSIVVPFFKRVNQEVLGCGYTPTCVQLVKLMELGKFMPLVMELAKLRKLVKLMELVRLRKLIKLMELVEKVKLMEIVKLRRCRPTSL